MADQVFNISKGSWAEMIRNGPNALLVLLLQANEVETALVDHETVQDLLAAPGNTEADFTNYTRQEPITGTLNVDHVNDRVDGDIPDQTWSSAGNGQNNTLTKFVVAYENAANDANRVPVSHHDFAVTTDGNDLTAQIAADGFIRAS